MLFNFFRVYAGTITGHPTICALCGVVTMRRGFFVTFNFRRASCGASRYFFFVEVVNYLLWGATSITLEGFLTRLSRGERSCSSGGILIVIKGR